MNNENYEEKLWANVNDTIYELVTPAQVREYGANLLPDHFSSPDAIRIAIHCFWQISGICHTMNSSDVADRIFEEELDLETAEDWLTYSFDEAFDNFFFDDTDVSYLYDRNENQRLFTDFLNAARPYAEMTTKPGNALAGMTLLTTILSIPLPELPKPLFNALCYLNFWSEDNSVIDITSQKTLNFKLPDRTWTGSLSQVTLSNPSALPQQLQIALPDGGRKSLLFPPNGSLRAWFADESLCCIRPAFTTNNGYSVIQSNDTLRIFDRNGQTRSIPVPIGLQDFDITAAGILCTVQHNRAKIFTDNAQKIFNDSIGVFTADDLYLVWKKDGTSYSNARHLRITTDSDKRIFAVLKDEAGILLILNTGEVISSVRNQNIPCDSAISKMFLPFESSDDQISEIHNFRNFQLILSHDGTTERRMING